VSDPGAVKIIYNAKSGFTKTDFYPPFAPNISPHGDHFTQLDERKHSERRKFVNHIYSRSTILESEAYINACGVSSSPVRDAELTSVATQIRRKRHDSSHHPLYLLLFDEESRCPC
jgi:hypothetical protein